MVRLAMPQFLPTFSTLSPSDRRIVSLLLDSGPMSRAELADRTGVTRPAVTQMVASLDRFGLVEEGPSRRGLRGQPARPISIRGAAGYSGGISFSQTYLDAAIIDMTGRPIGQKRLPLTSPDPETVAKVAQTALLAIKAEASVKNMSLLGIGFAMPGDFWIGKALLAAHVYFPGFDKLDAQSFFQARFEERIFVENDGRTCIMGERLAGVGRGHSDFMLVHIGHGVGGGLFLDNRLYRGAHLNAGPLYTFFPIDQPRPSGQDLLETLRRAGFSAKDFDTLEEAGSDEAAVIAEWTTRAGTQLAPYLHHVANVLDPEFIIVGGRLPASILSAIVEATGLPLEALENQIAGSPPVVRASSLGAEAGAIGAASVPIFDLLHA
ncbi:MULTISPECIES: ROK family transcriptional regulator [unclassified Rhizobium]|nr:MULTISPECIES: ROK family transcriptional regulator [unclassified Rhizobium]